MVNAIANTLVIKEQIIKDCLQKINEISTNIVSYQVPDLKKVLEQIKNILVQLQVISVGVSGSPGGPRSDSAGNLNTDFMIDSKLKDELEMLSTLALRSSGASAELNNFKFNPTGINKSLSITGLMDN